MKRLIYVLSIAALTSLFSCDDEYDDTLLGNRVDNLEERLQKVEELCSKMNSNISSLQTIVGALETSDVIVSVTPVSEGGKQIGYNLKFASGKDITIYHGKDGAEGAQGKPGNDGAPGKDGADGAPGKDGADGAPGKDGHTPVIGVKTDVDGIYYWTLDGQWLLNEKGEKICAIGKDGADGAPGKDGADGAPGKDGTNGAPGKDGNDGAPGKDGTNGLNGITPQLKIEGGYWFVSTDEGKSWKQLAKATGENGKDGKDGDSMFKSFTYDEDYVYITLVGDTTPMVLTRHNPAADLTLTLETAELTSITPGGVYTVKYSVTGVYDNVIVRAVAENGWEAKAVASDKKTGIIKITAPDPLISGEVLVFASNGTNKTVMAAINCWKGKVTVDKNTTSLPLQGGTKQIAILTNLDYEVVIPEEAKSWLSCADSRAAMREETLTFTIAENKTNLVRKATVTLQEVKTHEVLESIVFTQAAAGSAITAEMTVEPGQLEQMLTEQYGDYTTLTELKLNGQLNAADFTVLREKMPKLTTLDLAGLNMVKLPDGALASNSNNKITKLILPNGLTEISPYAFKGTNLKDVVIPETVEKIGEKAFYDTYLTSIIIPKNVKVIEPNTFAYCLLSSISFEAPSALTTIGDEAFAYLEKVKSLEIPASVETIGNRAFKGKGYYYGETSILSNITFMPGSKLTSIGDEAFYNHPSLSGIKIQKKVKSIGAGAFKECGLKTLTFETGSELSVIKEKAFESNDLTSVVIPDGVTSIANRTFAACHELASVTLPENTLSIGDEAFSGCSKLSSEIFSNLKQLTTIGKSAFSSCTAFMNVSLPATVTALGESAFSNCTNVMTYNTLPAGLSHIGKDTFYRNEALKSLTIPANVEYLGQDAFRDCTNMTTLTFAPGSKVKEILPGSFNSCNKLTAIALPDALTEIGKQTFINCATLTTLKMPAQLTSIGYEAFKGCTALTEVDFTGCKVLELIGYRAFENCGKLGNLTLPKSLKTIDKEAFQNCGQLKTLTFEKGSQLNTIKESAFYECNALKAVALPQTVEKIEQYAFLSCDWLASVTFEPGSKLKELQSYAFSQCVALTDLSLPDGINSIPSNLCSGCTALQNISLPANVITIGDNAFGECKQLKAVPMSGLHRLLNIGNYAFKGCQTLTDISIPDHVENLGSNLFENCTALKTVKLPKNLTVITAYMFSGCKALQNDVLNGLPYLNDVKSYAFAGCGFTSFTVPETVKLMGTAVFKNCQKLETVQLPSSRQTISDETFYGCTVLKSSVFSNLKQLTTIGKAAFYGCKDLIDVTLPDKVETLKVRCFAYCSNMESVTLPAELKVIEASAFMDCGLLTKVDGSKCTKVTNIGQYSNSYSNKAFINTVISSFKLNTAVPPILEEGIDIRKVAVLEVPAAAVEAYKKADGWKNFTTIKALP